MIRSDFREFQGQGVNELLHYGMSLSHSAKGSTWEDHKYVKKIDGVYYYPVGYEDGRTIDDLSSKNRDDKKEEKNSKSTKEKIEQVKYHFDEYLKEKDIDWRTLPKEEVDAVQRTIVRLLESGGSDSIEELLKNLKPEKKKKKTIKNNENKSEEMSMNKVEEKKKKKTTSFSSIKKKSVDLNKVFSVYRNKEKK